MRRLLRRLGLRRRELTYKIFWCRVPAPVRARLWVARDAAFALVLRFAPKSWPVPPSTWQPGALYKRHALLQGEGLWDEMHDLVRRTHGLQEMVARRRGFDLDGPRYVGQQFLWNIGTMSMLDILAKQDILSGSPGRTTVLADPSWVANRAYLDCWREHFPVVDDPATVKRLTLAIAPITVYPHTWRAPEGDLQYVLESADRVEERWETDGRAPLPQLSDTIRRRGAAELARLGVPEDAWFVALHVRESLTDTLRNASVTDYIPALKAVVAHGGWVIRMGDSSMTPLPPLGHVIDYVHTDAKSDWMDVFLLSDARFMIGTESGPTAVAGTFGTPAVVTNWMPAHRANWFRNHICAPKVYRSLTDGRLIPFPDVLATRAGLTPNPTEAAGIVPVNNTPGEIEELVMEMLDVLAGDAAYSARDEELQRRYKEYQPPIKYPFSPAGARIGREWAERYADLFMSSGRDLR